MKVAAVTMTTQLGKEVLNAPRVLSRGALELIIYSHVVMINTLHYLIICDRPKYLLRLKKERWDGLLYGRIII